MFFLDCINEKEIHQYIHLLKQHQIEVFLIKQHKPILSPSEIRFKIIKTAIELQCDLLIMSDFDEVSDPWRVQRTIEQIGDNDFGYNSFFITDFYLNKILEKDFYTLKSIPTTITNYLDILSFNFIGLGSLAIKPQNILLPKSIDNQLLAFDWFFSTYMLLHKKVGIKIQNTFVKYRQHSHSLIGIGKKLSKESLQIGISVKKQHYSFFKDKSSLFQQKLDDILELEIFLQKNQDKYIKIINENFNPTSLCWWENIKTLKEIKQWI